MKASRFVTAIPAGLTAHCGGGSGGWASGRLLQESDRSPQEPVVPQRTDVLLITVYMQTS